jgi:TolB-like protein
LIADDKSSGDSIMSMSSDARRALLIIALIFVTLAGAAFVMVRKRWHTPLAPAIRSIAVLPFKPVADRERQPIIERQLMLAVMVRIESLSDVSVTGASRADALLNGTIDTSEGRIRVEARLLRVADGKEIWQGRFDRPHDQAAALQQSLAEQVIEAAKMP